jgi:hypothetical protein
MSEVNFISKKEKAENKEWEEYIPRRDIKVTSIIYRTRDGYLLPILKDGKKSRY